MVVVCGFVLGVALQETVSTGRLAGVVFSRVPCLASPLSVLVARNRKPLLATPLLTQSFTTAVPTLTVYCCLFTAKNDPNDAA